MAGPDARARRDLYWVRTQAVPRLVTGMEPPEPALPTRYEIAVGYEDEYRAMAAGSGPPPRIGTSSA